MGEPVPVVRLKAGQVVTTTGEALAVNVDGSLPPAWWPAGYIPQSGDAVRVLMVDGAAVVLGPVTAGQRSLTGTVSGAPSSGTVPVSTTDGTLACRYVGTPPDIGELVRLDWQSTTPWIWPSTAATVPTPDDQGTPGTTPTPPPPVQGGTLSVTAIDSGTWSSRGVWDSYYGTHLTQGSYSGRTYSGAWFYGDAPGRIRGRTVTALRLRLGARRRMGNYNSPLDLQVRMHSSRTRPGGEVAHIAGPQVITLPPGAGPQWVNLDPAWGQHIADNGGGISIAGGSYGGVDGIGADPASGQLQFDWRA